MRFLRVFALLATLLLCADQVKLQDGTIIEGKLKRNKNNVTIVDKDGKMFQYSIRQVSEINGVKMEQEKNPVVRICTSEGEIECELFEDEAPNTVANFIQLAENGFYQGMAFHRIINGFMAQGGCPYSKRGAVGPVGTGGPGYTFGNECTPTLTHEGRGILSMANTGRPNSNGSQFFLCFQECNWLNGKHTVFGKVIKGMEVLDKLEAAGTRSGTPTKEIRFSIEVVSKRDHKYEVKKAK